jgi:Putative zinc-finger
MEYPGGYTCEHTLLRLERYLLAELPLVEALAVAEHIEACVSCAQHLVLVLPQREVRRKRGR